MNCLIWNIRRLRGSESQQRLHAHVKEKQIKVLAVLEPLIDLDPRFMTRRLGFSGVISNLSGHIWVFFAADVRAECVFDHAQFLHIRVSASFLPTEIFCSFVYARSCFGSLAGWGDFNVIRDASECLGSRGGRLLPMEEFNTFILDSGLIDAGFEGSSFTWTNKTIWKRLDRVLVSVDWGDHFSSIRVEHLARTVSDHCPLLVTAPVFARGPSSFRFQRMWVRHHGFLQTVRLNWNLPCSLSGMPRLFAKMKRLKHHLRWWNRDVFGSIFDRLTEAERGVRSAEDVCEADPSDANWTSLSDRNEDLARITAMEADFWKQKAACHWLEDGEQNTRLFHNMVKKKRVANKIFRIWENGVCLTSQDLIQQSGALFFQDLLTGEPSALDCPDFSGFSSVISVVEKDGIAAIPSLEEVRATVFSIHPDSVAGPDGFSSEFFQHCWEIVHQDVFGAVLDFFQGSPMPQGFTATHDHSYSQSRGCTRLVGLPSDQPVQCHEQNHLEVVVLSVEGCGGETCFPESEWLQRVVALVSACISHCHFSVNINGLLSGFFGSTRGLRQGDPLSPLLFVLGAEYLSRGLDRLYLQHPALRYRSDCDILISHLAYADDVIIFASGGTRGMQRLVDFLHHYENCSGQRVNAAKSSLILPPRCSGRLRSRLLRITGFAEGHLPSSTSEFPFIGVVQPPLAVMEKLERAFNAFLWGSRPLERKWHWARWSRACLPVLEGGLGFRRLKDLVECFSIKLWFRFRQGASLWARFLFRKYCRLDAPSCVPARASISPIWRRLLRIRPRAEPGMRWRVGLGDVSFWDDTWFGDVPLSSRCVVRGGRDVRVSHFLSEGSWDFDRLCAVVAPSVAEEIILIPVISGDPDLARWIHSSDGAFSVRSAWELIRQRAPSSDIFRPCWGSWLRPTMSFFLWRFRHQWLPVDEVLQRRGFALASRCQCCDMSETFTHIFIRSPVARSVWHFFGAVFRVRIPDTEDFSLFLSAWKRDLVWSRGGHVREFLPCIVLWFLWTAWNDAKHRHLPISGETVKFQILSYLRLAHSARTVKPRHWLGEFHVARLLGISVALHRFHRTAIVRWLRPPSGCFKLNVDGSSRGTSGDSSAGGIVRDDSGRVVLSFSEFIGAGFSLRAELWAVLLLRGFLFSPVLPVWCEWAQTLAHYMFGLLGIGWALALILLVLFFGPLIFPGALFLLGTLFGPLLVPGGRLLQFLLARRLSSFTGVYWMSCGSRDSFRTILFIVMIPSSDLYFRCWIFLFWMDCDLHLLFYRHCTVISWPYILTAGIHTVTRFQIRVVLTDWILQGDGLDENFFMDSALISQLSFGLLRRVDS
ncbi:uncharacterized protein [Primulina eburnea]|uniref:uncharacterized protein n=1 Tax=Primulina eburnea TaxID=1245227 RepID=UPI003C6C3100